MCQQMCERGNHYAWDASQLRTVLRIALLTRASGLIKDVLGRLFLPAKCSLYCCASYTSVVALLSSVWGELDASTRSSVAEVLRSRPGSGAAARAAIMHANYDMFCVSPRTMPPGSRAY